FHIGQESFLNHFFQDRDAFFAHERVLLEHAMALVQTHNPEAVSILRQSEFRLNQLAAILSDYPGLESEEELGPFYRDVDTLLEVLCALDPLELKLRLPSKALLVESYMVNKAQHLKGVLAMIASIEPHEESALQTQLFLGIREIVHSYLLYQLLLDVILDERVEMEVKRKSARYLIALWDTCAAQRSLSGFFEYIRSLWDARILIRVQYGTLLGTSELFQLLEQNCEPKVLAYFMERTLSEEESWAFQEFLLGLSYEQLLLLHERMKKHKINAISSSKVKELLTHSEPQQHLESHHRDPHRVYRSYKRRRFQARSRLRRDLPGPRRTAEEYLVFWLLTQE
ncbi:MAG: hypothetical protein AAGJ35_02380, partial [Myxococcota bacterium]